MAATGRPTATAETARPQKQSPRQLEEALHVPASLSLVVLVAVVVVPVVVGILAAAPVVVIVVVVVVVVREIAAIVIVVETIAVEIHGFQVRLAKCRNGIIHKTSLSTTRLSRLPRRGEHTSGEDFPKCK